MADQVIAVIKEFERFTERLVRKVVLDVVANLQRPPSQGGTPVDTGWARANWVAYLGRPGPDLGTHGREQRSRAAAAAGAAGGAQTAATVAAFRLPLGPVWISNGVPYIGRLNAGSSTQAPRNFVQAAITKAITRDIRTL